MGIRFQCHVCEKQLNIKQELAGKRGKCPACSSRFRIPLTDAEYSIPLDDDGDADRGAAPQTTAPQTTAASGTVRKITPTTPAPPSATDSPGEPAVKDWDDGEEAVWYVRPPSGGQYGPASTAVLQQWIEEGRVAATALLWRDGWPQWRSANEALPQLADRLPTSGAVASVPKSPARTSDSSSTEIASSNKPLSGSATVGTQRRVRSTRRILSIGLLAAVAVALIAVLAFVVNR